jgi:hypothetical protein
LFIIIIQITFLPIPAYPLVVVVLFPYTFLPLSTSLLLNCIILLFICFCFSPFYFLLSLHPTHASFIFYYSFPVSHFVFQDDFLQFLFYFIFMIIHSFSSKYAQTSKAFFIRILIKQNQKLEVLGAFYSTYSFVFLMFPFFPTLSFSLFEYPHPPRIKTSHCKYFYYTQLMIFPSPFLFDRVYFIVSIKLFFVFLLLLLFYFSPSVQFRHPSFVVLLFLSFLSLLIHSLISLR